MLGYLEYFLVKFLNLIIRAFPQKAVVYVAGLIGSLFYFIDCRHRNISLRNLENAFGKTKSLSEIKKISRHSFMNLSQNFFEVLLFPKFNRQSLDKFVSIEGRENLDMVRSRGKGAILLTAHFGNWELSAVWASLNGYPISVIARDQKKTRLNALLNQYRTGTGIKVYSKGLAVRDLMRALNKNEFVGILGDQDAGKRGVFVDFFNRPASTNPGPVLLAIRKGVPVLPCFIVRSGFRHKIYVNPPLYKEIKVSDKNNAEMVKSVLQEFSRILESYIRLYPGQWLWVHKRWKTQPVRNINFDNQKFNIMVLSDEKPGHLRQCQGVLRGFPAAKVLKVEIKFKNRFWKILLSLVAPVVNNKFVINAFLRQSLRRESFNELNSFLPGLIISAGSSLAPCNLLYGRITRARKIVCMKPGIINVKFFDLVIAPQHDHLPVVKNVLNILTAPHPFRNEDFDRLAKELKEKFSIKGNKFFGILLGGESTYFFISDNSLKKIVEKIKLIGETHKFPLLLTTSRRTPLHVEKELKKTLNNFSDLALFISPREESYNPVGGILGLSELIIVTEDSISMIAEAASSGKKIVVLGIDRKVRRKPPKHLETLNKLTRQGYIRMATPDNLNKVVDQFLEDATPVKILNDTEKAIERVKALLVNG